MPVKIHGRQYITVAERLNQLNKNEDGNYSLESEMIYFKDGMVVFKAILTVGENVFIGHAMEKENASTINKTSYLECAESSSWGRALAAAGYIGSQLASADEVITAMKNQTSNLNKPEFATPNQVKYIKSLCEEKNMDSKKWDFDNLSKQEAGVIIETIIQGDKK